MKRKQFKTSEQLKKEKELQASWQEVLKANQHRSSTPPKNAPFSPMKVSYGTTAVLLGPKVFRRETPKPKSVLGRGYVPTGPSVGKPTYTPEMQEREEAAQKAIAEKRSRVAPAFNKGGLQYISNPDDFKTMGRKV